MSVLFVAGSRSPEETEAALCTGRLALPFSRDEKTLVFRRTMDVKGNLKTNRTKEMRPFVYSLARDIGRWDGWEMRGIDQKGENYFF